MKLWGKIIFWVSFAAAAVLIVGYSYRVRYAAEGQLRFESSAAQTEAQNIQEKVVLFTERAVPAGIPFAAMLQRLGFTSALSSVSPRRRRLFERARLPSGEH